MRVTGSHSDGHFQVPLCEIKASDRQEDVSKISIGILNGYVIFCVSDKYVPVDLYCLIVVTTLN